MRTVTFYTLLSFCSIFLSSTIQAQDQLTELSFEALDSLYEQAKNSQERLPYALAMLEKGEQELHTQDTAFAKILYKVSGSYISLRDLQNGSAYLKKCIEIQKEKIPKSLAYASSLNTLGIVYAMSGQLDKVEPLFLESLDIKKEVLGEKHPEYANSLGNLGLLYWNTGQYAKAEPFYLQTLKIQKEVFGEKHPEYAKVLHNVGLLYKSMGDFAQAEPFYIQAMNIKKEALGEEHPDYAVSLNNLSNLYRDMGEHAQAEPLCLQTLQVNKKAFGEKHPEYAKSVGNLGLLYYSMGDLKKAEPFYLQTLAIQKEVVGEKHPDYANSLTNTGVLYSNMEDLAKAESYYLQALAIQKEVLGVGHPDYANSLNSLALLYHDLKQYSIAESSFLQALAIQKEALGEKHISYIKTLNNLGKLFKQMNQFDRAWNYVLAAIKANSNIDLNSDLDVNSLNRLATANIVSFEDMNKSLILLYLLLKKDNEGKNQQVLLSDLARTLLDRSKNELTDDSDKLRMLAQKSDWVLRSMQVLDKNTDAAKAWSIIEQNKSVLLLDAASNKEAYVSGLLPDSLIQQEKNLQKRYNKTKATLAEKRPAEELDKIRASLTSLNTEITTFKKNIQQNFPKYASMRYQHEAIQATEIQALLDDKTAILEYLIGDSMVYIFYVDKQQVKIHEFEIAHQQLENRIESLHQILSNYQLAIKNKDLSYRKYTDHAYWFYANLVAPALVNAQDIEQLIIVSDGALGHLPFEAFLVENQNNKKGVNFNSLHYLIDDYKISYNYSATLLKENKHKKNSSNNGQILGMAANYAILLDSSKSHWRLPSDARLRAQLNPLPAARKEVEAIQAHFSGFFAFDSLASEKNFKEKAANFGVIHLAMHGLLNKKEPVLSSLAFTEVGDSAENNFLCAYEISKMELNADLVILSACETGYGKFEKGNGIASLARSFMYAGVPAIIVSLWQVNDYATSKIMQNLYKNLADGMTKDEALRQAKLQYIQSVEDALAHPAFWSPFIMMGNTESITISKKGGTLPWKIGGAALVLVLGAFAWRKRTKKEPVV